MGSREVADNLDFDSDSAVERLVQLYQSDGMQRRQRLALEAARLSVGETVVDLGCGPGFYLEPLRRQVGDTGHVIGVDPTGGMLDMAANRAAGTELREGSATAIPLDESSVDAVFSVQVFEYLDDVRAALREVWRVLRPGGRVVIWDTDWSSVSWHSQDPARMDLVLKAWDQHLADPVLPRTLAPALRACDFVNIETAGHAFTLTDAKQGTMARGLLDLIHDYVRQRPDFSQAAADSWREELLESDAKGEFFLAYLQYAFTATRP